MPTPVESFAVQTTQGDIYRGVVYCKEEASEIIDSNVVYLFLGDKNIYTNIYPILYIGQTTQSACDRFSNHEKWLAAELRGFAYIGIINLTANTLDDVEQTLIQSYTPPCNVIMYN